MSGANVVDSSGWLEYFAGTDRGALFAPAIQDQASLVVPVLVLYEVFKKMLRELGEGPALEAAAAMQTGQVVDLSSSLALEAASLDLPLADSVIYATARRHGALLWTQDEHFQRLPNVRFFAKL